MRSVGMGKVMKLLFVVAGIMRVVDVRALALTSERQSEEKNFLPRTIVERRVEFHSHYSENVTLSRRLTLDAFRVFTPKGSITTFSSIVPIRPNRKSSAISAAQHEMTFYLDFLADYVKWKEWSSAIMIFPYYNTSVTATQISKEKSEDSDVEKEICEFFRINLLHAVGLVVTCVSNYPESKLTVQDIIGGRLKPQPIIALDFQFLYKSSGNSLSVSIHPKFLIDYRCSRPIVLVSASKMLRKEIIIDQIQPEINSNYKWTLVLPMPQNRSSTNSNLTNATIHDIYGFATSSTPIPHHIGFWAKATGMDIDIQKSFGLSDFMGNRIRITSVAAPPVVYLTTTPQGVQGSGYLFDVLDAISSHLNFTFELLPPLDNNFGAEDATGNWSGMVGMLQRKEAEMALMSFSLTAARKTVMDFSPPIEYSSTRLLIRRDWKNAEIKWNAFLRPFEWKVWVAIPVAVTAGVVTLLIFSHFQIIQTTPGNSAWILSSCFLLQGHTEQSSALPYRIALGMFWILALVVYASYTARLTSFLAATPDNMPIHSLAEAVNNRNWKMGATKGSAVLDRVRDSSLTEMKLFWKRLQDDSSGLVGGFQEGIQKVYQERYVFFTSDLVPSYLVKGNCSFAWLPGNYFPGFGYMGYQKNLAFASVISQRVSQLRETGQMKRLFRKWWGTESSCSSSGDAFVGMSLYETGTAFLILLLGLAVALTFIIAEFCFRKTLNDNSTLDLLSSNPDHLSKLANSDLSFISRDSNIDHSLLAFQYSNGTDTQFNLDSSIQSTLSQGGYGMLYK